MKYLIIVGRDISPSNSWSRVLPRLKKADPALYKKVTALPLSQEISFPESGHHPAKVWDLLQAEIQRRTEGNTDNNPLIIIVTHSEALLNQFGYQVEDNNIPAKNVTVMVVPEDDSEPLELCSFDEAGYMEDPWPFGFFSWR